jgi:hypothetical protein
MSLPLIPFARWQSGTNENSLPANDNSLRSEIGFSSAISDSVTAQPAFTSPDDDGKWYIIPAGATGAQWSTFAENSAAIFYGGTWYEFTPVENSLAVIEGVLYYFDGTNWEVVAGGGGGGGSGRSAVTAVSSSSGVVTLDYALGDYFTLTLTENVTSWVISNTPGSGKGFTLMVQITQAATPYTVAKPGTTAGGIALNVSTGNADVDVLAISSFNNGTTLRSSIAKDFA